MTEKIILAINGGSSTLKYAAFEAGSLKRLRGGQFQTSEGEYEAELGRALDLAEGATGDSPGSSKESDRADGHKSVVAVGHRVVHGGMHYSEPTRLDERAMEDLRDLVRLAPLHQPHNLRAIEHITKRYPGVPQVACFDTAFHRSQPRENQLYALPLQFAEEGVIRYGFHGLSYEYVAGELARQEGRAAKGRAIVLHLGNGSSACAMKNLKSVATTMGFTALDGLMMGQRCGRIDPGVILHLMEKGMEHDAIQDLLYKRSGLLGISGASPDMRELLSSGTKDSDLAFDMFCRYAVRAVGELAAELQGLDTLVFTAGIGENQPPVRGRICEELSWLGVDLDRSANESGDETISSPCSKIEVLVIPTNEELVVARHVSRVLAAPNCRPSGDRCTAANLLDNRD